MIVTNTYHTKVYTRRSSEANGTHPLDTQTHTCIHPTHKMSTQSHKLQRETPTSLPLLPAIENRPEIHFPL